MAILAIQNLGDKSLGDKINLGDKIEIMAINILAIKIKILAIKNSPQPVTPLLYSHVAADLTIMDSQKDDFADVLDY